LGESLVTAATSLQNLPLYFGFIVLILAMIAVCAAIHILITPFNEIRLIRAGNRAAALSLGGALIGYALPLTILAASTSDITVLLAWGIVALVLQLVTFAAAMLLLGNVRQSMMEDKISYGIILGAISIVVGLVNAGSLT
jgi:putative membrane protein